MGMPLLKNHSYRRCKMLLCMLSLVVLQTGCQKLFHDQDALLKGQTVTVSMTVPDVPPPAAQPLAQQKESTTQPPIPPKRSLDSRLLPVQEVQGQDPLPVGVPVKTRPDRSSRTMLSKADTVLIEKTVTEDMVLRGTVLVKGSLVVAPQATLRIEAGTVVRFAAEPVSMLPSRLIIQGRIVANGTTQQPVVLAPALTEAVAGDWGGVVLLNSEKKNSFEHCRIEGAQTGISAHFSRFTAKGLVVTQSQWGIELYDSEASLQGCTLYRCEVGLKLTDSELDVKDSTVRENRQGFVAQRSSFTMSNNKITNNSQEGAFTEQSRFRITGSLFAENRTGARFVGGDGQLFLCSFQRNREHGAELRAVRIKIRSSSFVYNTGAGLILENARGILTGSVIAENLNSNLKNEGREAFAAELNWWGSSDPQRIAAGILDAARREDGSGLVQFVPFLKERPTTAP